MARQRRDSEAAAARWRVVSLAVFLVALAATLLTLDDPGLAWDEPSSILPGHFYAAWLGELPRLPFSREAIDHFWAPNHEHPPLAKVLMGISQALIGRGSPILASRIAVAMLFALLVELVLKMGAGASGGLAGLLAAVSLLCMPRVFGHAHLAALDLPMALTWLLAVAAFARAVDKGTHRACALSGLCFGLALLTKINAVFLPLVFLGWGIGFHRRRALEPLAWTLLLGPAVFFIGWPWLWHDPAARLGAYLRAPQRVTLYVQYFGRVYADKSAPWHYPLVMTLVTIPVGILALVCGGAVAAARRFRREPMLALVLINVAVILGVFMVPGVPKYDGVRLFLPVFPFLALLAGIGGERCWNWIARRSRKRPWRPLLATAVFFLSQAAAYGPVHPCELSYYNALVGGLWGADKLGMETTYWHECVTRRLFQWLNRRCQRGHVVAFYPVGEQVVLGPHPRTRQHMPNFYDTYYLNFPRDKGLKAVRLEHAPHAHFVVINARRAILERYHPEALRILDQEQPLFAVTRQGVLLAAVYAGK